MKRALAVCLGVAMVVCLLCANLTVTADGKTWVDFDPQLMTVFASNDGQPKQGLWSAPETGISKDYLNVGNLIMRPHTNGYAAIRRFDFQKTGTMYLTELWGNKVALYLSGGNPSGDYTGATMDFGIVNQDHELVWPTNGEFYTFTYGETYSDTISIDVTAGDSLYFIATNPSHAATTLNIQGIAYVGNAGSGQFHSGGWLCSDDMRTQGGTGTHPDVGKWYYMYAKSVSLTNADPNGDSNMGGGEYTVDYGDTLTAMHKISTANGDPHNGWLGNAAFNATPFVPHGDASTSLYFGGGNHAQITRYTATTSGDFRIGYAGLQLKGSSWQDGTGVDFCIVDHTGKVVYPENGGVVEIRAGADNPFDRAGAAAFYYSNLQAGEHLDFVFIPRGLSASGVYDKYLYLAGSFTQGGSRVDAGGSLFLNKEEQGSRGVTMYTASSVSVNKVADGEWKEFVQLESGLTAAPATAEVQVKIPENVADWKVGTIISDMEGTAGNGFAVMMDTFGHPRFVSGGFDWTVKNVDLRTGAWTRLTFTADTATGKAYCYINGTLAAETDINASLAVSGKAPVIGNDLSYTFTTAFEGSMKKLALASTVRSEEQVASEMTASDAAHYWVLNGVYTDKIGGIDGTLTQVNSDWYENGKPADAEEGEYTIVHIGDNQVVTDFINDGYQEVTQWIAENAERLNIQMVINSGDLVNYETTKSQWVDAKAGMDILKAAGIPYVYALGNHEYPESGGKARTSYWFNDYFAIEDHLTQGAEQANETKLTYAYPKTGKISSVDDLMLLENNTTGVTSYGNTYVETMENAVYMATLGGKQYAIIALEVQPRKEVVTWANTVLAAIEDEYADITTIVVEHYYIGPDGKIGTEHDMFNAAERALDVTPIQLWEQFVSQHESIQLVLSGHVATGIATRTDIGVKGNKVVSIMNDQSYEGNGGEGNILLLRCKADGTVIKAEYYSTNLERYYQRPYQFDFDTAADSELKLSLPKMTASTTVRSDKDAWLHSTWTGATLVGNRLLGSYTTYAAVRAYEVQNTGTMSYKLNYDLNVSGSNNNVELTLCKADGTVLWPASGLWKTVTGVFSETVTDIPVVAGEKIYLIIRNRNTSHERKYINITSSGNVKDANGNTLESFNSNSSTTGLFTTGEDGAVVYGQGHNNWYAYTCNGTKITTVPFSYTVTYGVDGDGGTLAATTSGDWAADKCVVPSGGTVRFTAKPKLGYRIAGYYVNGVYYKHTRRILTLPMIKEDLNVVVKFAKDKVEGDANGDGVINILDMVNMNNGLADDAAFTDKSVCDLVDNIAAADGADVIDADDIKELRRRILE